ncbi:hypothetical protein BLX24_22735 [Arsenicibacter rosenii]|uniref:Uncharacterized protein n=1 Tax=Arsenicibacter rosenii TaxID=1750698 RepID=A0A1S2VET3_9BACT|nr:hypothetical protein BLX24_22735 [Arsenicibacter rosenii]
MIACRLKLLFWPVEYQQACQKMLAPTRQLLNGFIYIIPEIIICGGEPSGQLTGKQQRTFAVQRLRLRTWRKGVLMNGKSRKIATTVRFQISLRQDNLQQPAARQT